MADATFEFRLVETGGGTAGGGTSTGAPSGKGGDPMASPQTGERTAARQEAEIQGGGSARVLQELQQRTEEKRQPRVQPPKPQEIVNAEIVRSRLGKILDTGREAGQAVLSKVGLGRLAGAGALGVAGGVIGAVATGAALVARRQAQLSRELRPFSADLLISQARENLRTTMQNFELAERFGPALAEAERQRGRFGAAAREIGAGIAGGPIGQNVGNVTELGSRFLEGVNRLQQTFNDLPGRVKTAANLLGIVPLGVLSEINKALNRFGIGVDPFQNAEGNLLLFSNRNFPHAVVNRFPPGLNAITDNQFGTADKFTTNQDFILDQI